MISNDDRPRKKKREKLRLGRIGVKGAPYRCIALLFSSFMRDHLTLIDFLRIILVILLKKNFR